MKSILRCSEAIDDDFVDRAHGDAIELLTQSAYQNRVPKAVDRVWSLSMIFQPVFCAKFLEVFSRRGSDQLDQSPSDGSSIDEFQIGPIQQ